VHAFEQMAHIVIISWFVALSFCVCFASFTFCYAFWPTISIKGNGQMRSLSGVMKGAECKPYFRFVMGCLGGSLFLATGMQSFNEITRFQRDFVLVLSILMYVCFLGLVSYDVSQSKKMHLSFVFGLIAIGYVFSNSVICCEEISSGGSSSSISKDVYWGSMASAFYNLFTTLFLICVLFNSYMHSQGFSDYHTVQTYFEIVWVLSLVFMLCVYAFDEVSRVSREPRTTPSNLSSGVNLTSRIVQRTVSE
jgi:hypothetical protein